MRRFRLLVPVAAAVAAAAAVIASPWEGGSRPEPFTRVEATGAVTRAGDPLASPLAGNTDIQPGPVAADPAPLDAVTGPAEAPAPAPAPAPLADLAGLAGVAGLPAAGTSLDSIDVASVPGAYDLPDGRTAVPLRSAPPDWVTPELLARAAEGPVAAPAAAIADVPASGYVGIRPGSEMIAPSGCTMNFVFRKSGVYAIGTAGHCVDSVGQPVTLLTVAPGSGNPVVVTIGNVLSMTDNGIGADFALVSIKPALQSWVFPTIAQVGGPCGAYTGDGLADVPLPRVFKGQSTSVEPETVAHYGHGIGIGTGGTPRAGVALYWETDAFYWDSPSIFGDSGSPVRVTNRAAAGDLTHLVVDPRKPGAVVAGTRISKMIKLTGGYTLVNSPYC